MKNDSTASSADVMDLGSMMNELKNRLLFVMGLIKMGEEPEEYDYLVDEAAGLCERTFSLWLGQNGLSAYEANLVLIVHPFLRYRFLHDIPRSHKYMLTVSPALKRRFIDAYHQMLGISEIGMAGFLSEIMVPFENFLKSIEHLTMQ